MPEFILDHGSPEGSKTFRSLDYFTQGYIEAMFFTDTEPNTARDGEGTVGPIWQPDIHSSLPGDVSFSDLAPETLAKIIQDCERFQTANAALLETASELEPRSESFRYARFALDDERLGQLFWYARCGHGVGFTDDGNAECLHGLQKAAQSVGSVDSCLGDDGLIYIM